MFLSRGKESHTPLTPTFGVMSGHRGRDRVTNRVLFGNHSHPPYLLTRKIMCHCRTMYVQSRFQSFIPIFSSLKFNGNFEVVLLSNNPNCNLEEFFRSCLGKGKQLLSLDLATGSRGREPGCVRERVLKGSKYPVRRFFCM